jgi:hypothetical protein
MRKQARNNEQYVLKENSTMRIAVSEPCVVEIKIAGKDSLEVTIKPPEFQSFNAKVGSSVKQHLVVQ